MAQGEQLRTAVVNRLCEFLIVATHAVVYIHQVYPQRMFEMRDKYGVATFYSKHAAVNEYIASTVRSMHQWLLDDAIECITIAVYDADSQNTLARYTFEPSVIASSEQDVDAASLCSLDNALRAHLCRILANAKPTAAQPHASRSSDKTRSRTAPTFDYIVHTKGVRADTTWMPADGREQRALPHARTVALKDADARSRTARLRSFVQLHEQRSRS